MEKKRLTKFRNISESNDGKIYVVAVYLGDEDDEGNENEFGTHIWCLNVKGQKDITKWINKEYENNPFYNKDSEFFTFDYAKKNNIYIEQDVEKPELAYGEAKLMYKY